MDLVTSLLCHHGYHTGMFDSGKGWVNRIENQDGTLEKITYLRQKRNCTRCGTFEIKDLETARAVIPHWNRTADDGE